MPKTNTMHDTIKEYLAYNEWATKKINQYCASVKEHDWDEAIPGSFDTLRKTFYHTIDAQSIWLQRLAGKKEIQIFSKQNPNIQGAMNVYALTSRDLSALYYSYAPEQLSQSIEVYDMSGNLHLDEIQDIFMHVVNHGTYHRGQIINFMRKLGYTENVPATDFIKYKRSLK
jgi:uncharacterized damage-inducible protein DinB